MSNDWDEDYERGEDFLPDPDIDYEDEEIKSELDEYCYDEEEE